MCETIEIDWQWKSRLAGTYLVTEYNGCNPTVGVDYRGDACWSAVSLTGRGLQSYRNGSFMGRAWEKAKAAAIAAAKEIHAG